MALSSRHPTVTSKPSPKMPFVQSLDLEAATNPAQSAPPCHRLSSMLGIFLGTAPATQGTGKAALVLWECGQGSAI